MTIPSPYPNPTPPFQSMSHPWYLNSPIIFPHVVYPVKPCLSPSPNRLHLHLKPPLLVLPSTPPTPTPPINRSLFPPNRRTPTLVTPIQRRPKSLMFVPLPSQNTRVTSVLIAHFLLLSSLIIVTIAAELIAMLLVQMPSPTRSSITPMTPVALGGVVAILLVVVVILQGVVHAGAHMQGRKRAVTVAVERLEEVAHHGDGGSDDGQGGLDEAPEDEGEGVICAAVSILCCLLVWGVKWRGRWRGGLESRLGLVKDAYS